MCVCVDAIAAATYSVYAVFIKDADLAYVRYYFSSMDINYVPNIRKYYQ